MFFKNKKPKLDAKVRYQNRGFNQKLQQARSFKRTAKPISESSVQKFFEQIGLGNNLRKAFTILIVGGLIYLVYAPNFLTLKQIEIEGLPTSEKEQAIYEVNSAINNAKFYNPQHNLVFTSEARIRSALAKISRIDSIVSIHKNFKTHSIYITIMPKYERFLVKTDGRVYDVFNDGSLKGVTNLDKMGWENDRNDRAIKVNITAKLNNDSNAQFFTPETAKYIIELQNQLKGIIGSSLVTINLNFQKTRTKTLDGNLTLDLPDSSIATSSATDSTNLLGSSENEGEVGDVPASSSGLETSLPISAEELYIVMQKGDNKARTYNVIVDTKEDADELVQRLNLFLSQTAPDRFNLLSYVDLRIKDRAFVCLLGAACNN